MYKFYMRIYIYARARDASEKIQNSLLDRMDDLWDLLNNDGKKAANAFGRDL